MRRINRKQFLKIIKGEDLEFRISPFAFWLIESVVIDNTHLPYDLIFENSKFENLSFVNCHFSGDILIDNSKSKSLTFDTCQLHSLEIKNADVTSLEIKNAYEINGLIINDSAIDKLHLVDNPIYELIHLGCGNSIKNCILMNNGDSAKNSFSTKLFMCPERFDSIQVENITTDLLHIGTFGQYAHLSITDSNAEVVLIEECSPGLSKVNFENIQPLDKEASAIHLINTVFDQELFGQHAFNNYKVTKMHHSPVDLTQLIA